MGNTAVDDVVVGGLELPAPTRLTVPMGVVFASIKGGVYACTVAELDRVMEHHYTRSGSKLRRLVIAKSNALNDDPVTHAETREFYEDATPFELAVVAAWYDSSIRDEY